MPLARRTPAPADLAVCLAVLLAARAALVMTLADCFFTGEELAHGTITKALIDGLDVRLCDVNYVYYEGGGLLAGMLGVPLFLTVGPSLLSLKLIALFLDVANLVSGMFLAARFEARRAPLLFGLAYVLAPIACQQMSLINVGNHHLAISFFFLVLLFAARVRERPEGGRPRTGDLAALGLTAGFGTWANLMLGLLDVFVLVLLLVGRRRVLDLRSWSVMLGSFAVGMLPFWYMLASVGMRVLDAHGMDLRSPFGETPTPGTKGSLLRSAWDAMGPRGRAQCALLGLLPLLYPLARPALGAAARRAWWACASFAVLLIVVTVLSRFCPVDFYHYQDAMRLLPHAALLALIGAGVLAGLVASGARGVRTAGWALVAAQLSLGVWGTVELARAGKAAGPAEAWDVLTTTKGYDYSEYVPNLVAKFEPGDPLRSRAALGFREPDPGLLYPAITAAVYRRVDPGAIAAVHAELCALDAECWEALALGLGRGLLAGRRQDFCDALFAVDAAHLPPGAREILHEAIGRHGAGRHLIPEAFESDVAAAIRCGAPAAFFRGYGYRIYLGYRIDRSGAEAFLARWPAEVQGPLREGYEACRRLSSVGG